jgi:hypothetical protein
VHSREQQIIPHPSQLFCKCVFASFTRSSLHQMSNLCDSLALRRNTLLSITSNIKIMRPSGGLVPVRAPAENCTCRNLSHTHDCDRIAFTKIYTREKKGALELFGSIGSCKNAPTAARVCVRNPLRSSLYIGAAVLPVGTNDK